LGGKGEKNEDWVGGRASQRIGVTKLERSISTTKENLYDYNSPASCREWRAKQEEGKGDEIHGSNSVWGLPRKE